MISKARVEELVKERIEQINAFLVKVTVSTNNNITVLFDNKEGVCLKDCLEVSRYIENNLDRDLEDYQLRVCSPGIENPFLVYEQYKKNIGKDIQIKMLDGRKIKGRLISCNEDVIILENLVRNTIVREINKSGLERMQFLMKEIKETKLIIKFK